MTSEISGLIDRVSQQAIRINELEKLVVSLQCQLVKADAALQELPPLEQRPLIHETIVPIRLLRDVSGFINPTTSRSTIINEMMEAMVRDTALRQLCRVTSRPSMRMPMHLEVSATLLVVRP